MLYIRNPLANGLRGRVLHTRVKKKLRHTLHRVDCVNFRQQKRTPTYLVHISNISSKDLQNINNRAPMEQAYNKAVVR